ncbi:carbon-nitrogen family hydrolase [Lihuaxuella thermophila]|uniref:Predicted amidohydrolase n=1 Tax=Lihuaxuella thermophila TaxID=1173111 RepID=A0A1H8FY73_9BACL|nr:carbon-nitrogen family hydrolase [Lihuaxuella thermophila]SEN36187.1 Predicted amidohydrolase [Lihuaxuella thermophila]
MRISLIQMDVDFGHPERNQQRVKEWVHRAALEERADVVVLPELWNTAYDLKRLEEIADAGDLRKWLGQLANEFGIYFIAGSIANKKDSGIYNTTFVFQPDGTEIASYSKVHLFRLMDEEKYLQPGEKKSLFSIHGHLAGSIICYDLRFPEYIRSLALEGAALLFVPAQWPVPRLNHWRVLNQARAIENQMYVVAVNRVGEGGGNQFFGHSMVIDPWGKILAEGGEKEEILTVEIDLDEVNRVRKTIPVFEDRRPELY